MRFLRGVLHAELYAAQSFLSCLQSAERMARVGFRRHQLYGIFVLSATVVQLRAIVAYFRFACRTWSFTCGSICAWPVVVFQWSKWTATTVGPSPLRQWMCS